jgi:putative peptidoglycan binding protein
MSRIFVDSTTFTDDPTNVDGVMVYINGHYGVVTQAALEARYPHARFGHAWIDVNGSRPDADIRDWETGDKSGDLEDWVKKHNAHSGKLDAVIYCNKSTILEVRSKTKSQRLGKDYYLFVATLDGSQYKADGIIACQYQGQAQTHGHFDRTVVYDDRFWDKTGPSIPSKPVAIGSPNPKWPYKMTLKKGSRGDAVLALQKAFNRSGLRGVRGIDVDGDFGPQTETATKNFEAMQNLPQSKLPDGEWDGIAGNQVRARLILRGYMNVAGQATD